MVSPYARSFGDPVAEPLIMMPAPSMYAGVPVIAPNPTELTGIDNVVALRIVAVKCPFAGVQEPVKPDELKLTVLPTVKPCGAVVVKTAELAFVADAIGAVSPLPEPFQSRTPLIGIALKADCPRMAPLGLVAKRLLTLDPYPWKY